MVLRWAYDIIASLHCSHVKSFLTIFSVPLKLGKRNKSYGNALVSGMSFFKLTLEDSASEVDPAHPKLVIIKSKKKLKESL